MFCKYRQNIYIVISFCVPFCFVIEVGVVTLLRKLLLLANNRQNKYAKAVCYMHFICFLSLKTPFSLTINMQRYFSFIH